MKLSCQISILFFYLFVLNQYVQGKVSAIVRLISSDAREVLPACYGVFVAESHILMTASCTKIVAQMTLKLESSSEEYAAQDTRNNRTFYQLCSLMLSALFFCRVPDSS